MHILCSYIACEFAGIFNGMGSKVHMVVRGDKLLRGFDSECRAQVQENMEKRGIQVCTQCPTTRGGDCTGARQQEGHGVARFPAVFKEQCTAYVIRFDVQHSCLV